MESVLQATPQERLVLRKLVWVGPLTIVMVALVNLIICRIAVAFFGISDRFQNLQAPVVIVSTTVYLLLAMLAFVLVGLFTRRPIRFYRRLSIIALVLSFSMPIMALLGVFAVPGMTIRIFWTMIVVHFVSVAITVGLLTTLAGKGEKRAVSSDVHE